MKSEERHKLKSNELAQTLREIPDYFKKHGQKLLMVLVMVLVVFVGLIMYRNSQVSAQQHRSHLLQSVVSSTKSIQLKSVQQAQSAQQDDILLESYSDSAQPIMNSLSEIIEDGERSSISSTALLQKARVLRSQLFYANMHLPEEKKQAILNDVKKIYERALELDWENAMVSGAARVGLGLTAEDLLEWDKARELYQAVCDDAEGLLSGTIYPFQARQRLEAIKNLAEEGRIEFAWAAEVPEVADIDLSDVVTPGDTIGAMPEAGSDIGEVAPEPLELGTVEDAEN